MDSDGIFDQCSFSSFQLFGSGLSAGLKLGVSMVRIVKTERHVSKKLNRNQR